MTPRDFTEVYEQHVWRVYGYFSYSVRSRPDAEDLTQRTFERAWRAWGRYDERKAGVATWLMAIARNLLIDHRREQAARPRRELTDEGMEALEASADRVSLGLEPWLETALGELSERERLLIALRFGGDLSGPEIAELTGLTLANVQQILSRALRALRARADGQSQSALVASGG